MTLFNTPYISQQPHTGILINRHLTVQSAAEVTGGRSCVSKSYEINMERTKTYQVDYVSMKREDDHSVFNVSLAKISKGSKSHIPTRELQK